MSENVYEIVKHVPIPLCGVMLSFASLGTLFSRAAPVLSVLCGIVAVALLVLVVAKIIAFPNLIAADLGNRVLAGVAATFPMALMSLSVYVLPFSTQVAFAIWIFSVVVHLALIVNFVVRFVARGSLVDLTPACFVALVGLVLAALTGGAYPVRGFLAALFWVELAVTAVCLVAVTVRCRRFPPNDQVLRPLLCIYTAPPSMCLACGLAVYPAMPFGVLLAAYAACCGFYLFAFAIMTQCLRTPFTPGFASLTFPFVISATASIKAAAALASFPVAATAVLGIGYVQVAIASGLALYVLARFAGFLASFARQRA